MIFSNIYKVIRPLFLSNLKKTLRSMSTFDRGIHLLFNKYLVITNSIASGICMGIGDTIQQQIERYSDVNKKKYDWHRAGCMFTVGITMGPLHHYYYIKLDKFLPKADLKTVTLKVLADQLLASPPTILCFFYVAGVLENNRLSEITDEVYQKFKYVYLGDCLFWPPVQFVNFYFVSTTYRLIFVNMAKIMYDVFLSYMKHDV